MQEQEKNFNYAGFWIRVWASLIDSVLLAMISIPLLWAVYGRGYFASESKGLAGGADLLISWVLPAIAILWFWSTRQATPGKIALSLKIVDAKTGLAPSTGSLIGRYLGYFLSSVSLGLGLLWVAFDRKKQGWHDKLAGTVVVRANKTL